MRAAPSSWRLGSLIGGGAVFLAGVAPCRAQEPIWTVAGDAVADRFGSSVASMADVDGDGIQEVIASSWFFDFRNPTYRGTVRLLSGRDGAVLFEWRSPVGGSFGAALSDAGDADGDGIHDVAIGDPFGQGGVDKVQVFSGADGHKIFGYAPLSANSEAGTALAPLFDVDHDGHDDLLIGVPDANSFTGAVRVLSGLDGAVLRKHPGDANGDGLGTSVVRVPDLDGDGLLDYAAGASKLNGDVTTGYVRWFSGATGAILRTTNAPAGLYAFGTSVATAGDVDQDGIDDFGVSAPYTKSDPTFPFPDGAVALLSGADSSLLWTVVGGRSQAFLGALSSLGDVNGDQRPEFSAHSGFDGRILSVRSSNELYRFEGVISGITGPGDVDGDGRGDFAVGLPIDSEFGVVRLLAGNDLFLNATPDTAAAGDSVTFKTLEGEPGRLTLRVLIEVDGTPLFLPIPPIAAFGSDRQRLESFVVPPGLGVHHLVHVAFAQGPSGGIAVSAAEVLDLK